VAKPGPGAEDGAFAMTYKNDLMAMMLVQLAAQALPSDPPLGHAHAVVPEKGALTNEEVVARHEKRITQIRTDRKRRKKQKCRRKRS